MVDEKATCRYYAQTVILEDSVGFSRHALAFLRRPCAEHLHRARVSLRRINNLLEIFNDVLPYPRLKKWRRSIALAGKALGRGRDLDVWTHLLKGRLAKVPAARQRSGRALIGYLEREREQEQSLAQKILARLEERGIFKEVRAALGPARRCPRNNQALRAMGRQKISKRLKRFLAASSCARRPQDGKGLHRLRIKGKKLRYTLESFERVFGPSTKYFYTSVYALQTALGELHDAEMLVAFLQGLKNQGVEGIDRAALDSWRGLFAASRRAAYKRFLRLWNKAEKQKFWKALESFIERPS